MKRKAKRGSIICRICGQKDNRDKVHYTRGEIVTFADCERTGTGFIDPLIIVFSANPIHGDTPGCPPEEIDNCHCCKV